MRAGGVKGSPFRMCGTRRREGIGLVTLNDCEEEEAGYYEWYIDV
jgi:hypothetical protein